MRITLFYGELHEGLRHQPRLEPIVLAHVLVHELTHVLQGVSRHSEAGVMQAHWTIRDYSEMEDKPLGFTPDDADLVHFGLAKAQSMPAWRRQRGRKFSLDTLCDIVHYIT